MPDHPGTAPRRRAFGIDLSRPGVEKDHFVCAGYYTFTYPGLCEVVRSRMHVWVCTAFVYAEGVRSDRRATAYEPIIIGHIECTADGLGIQIFGKALLNWPRLEKYHRGVHKLPSRMKANPCLHVYSNWEVTATAECQEGFVGIVVGSAPAIAEACEDTIGVIGYAQVAKEGDDEILIVEQCVAYDATRHRRPSDFDPCLELLQDPDLEPIINPGGIYTQWQQRGQRGRFTRQKTAAAWLRYM